MIELPQFLGVPITRLPRSQLGKLKLLQRPKGENPALFDTLGEIRGGEHLTITARICGDHKGSVSQVGPARLVGNWPGITQRIEVGPPVGIMKGVGSKEGSPTNRSREGLMGRAGQMGAKEKAPELCPWVHSHSERTSSPCLKLRSMSEGPKGPYEVYWSAACWRRAAARRCSRFKLKPK